MATPKFTARTFECVDETARFRQRFSKKRTKSFCPPTTTALIIIIIIIRTSLQKKGTIRFPAVFPVRFRRNRFRNEFCFFFFDNNRTCETWIQYGNFRFPAKRDRKTTRRIRRICIVYHGENNALFRTHLPPARRQKFTIYNEETFCQKSATDIAGETRCFVYKTRKRP